MSTVNVSRVRKLKPPSPYDKNFWDALVPADPDNSYPASDFKPELHPCADETLETIAASTPCGTWQQLVRYNWGLSLSDKHLEEYVNWYLQNYCQCTKANGSDDDPGYNYVFDPASSLRQIIIIPKPIPAPAPASSVGSRGPKPTTIDADCPQLDPPAGASGNDSCKIIKPFIRCYKHPNDLNPKPPTITLPPAKSSVIRREFIDVASVIFTLTSRRISGYTGGGCRFGELSESEYEWFNETLYIEFMRETVSDGDIKNATAGTPFAVQRMTEDDYLNLAMPSEMEIVADVVGALETAGRLDEVIVRGYTDCIETDRKGSDDLALRRAEFIVKRLQSGWGLLQPPVKGTTIGCTGYYCNRPGADPNERAATVEIIANKAAPASTSAIVREEETKIRSYVLNRYKGPDLGSDFKRPKRSDDKVVRTSLEFQTEDKTQKVKNAAELVTVRRDAMSYFDRFVQLLYEGSAFAAGDRTLRSGGGGPSTIYDWIQSWRLSGEGQTDFPALDKAYKFKDLRTGAWLTTDKYCKISEAAYIVDKTATVVVSANPSRDTAHIVGRAARGSIALPLWGLIVRFREGLPPPTPPSL